MLGMFYAICLFHTRLAFQVLQPEKIVKVMGLRTCYADFAIRAVWCLASDKDNHRRQPRMLTPRINTR